MLKVNSCFSLLSLLVARLVRMPGLAYGITQRRYFFMIFNAWVFIRCSFDSPIQNSLPVCKDVLDLMTMKM